MPPIEYSAEWNDSCAQRPISVRDDATVNPAYFNFNWFVIVFIPTYYAVSLALFWWVKRSQKSAYLGQRDMLSLLGATFGVICILIVGPIRDNVGRQIFPCPLTLWARIFGGKSPAS